MQRNLRPLFFLTLSSFAFCSYIPQKDKHYFDYFLHREAAQLFHTKQFSLVKAKAIYGADDIDRVYLTFSCFRTLGVKEARKLLLETVNELLDVINNDPFLIEKRMLRGGHFCAKDLHLEIISENVFAKDCDNSAAIKKTILDDLAITYITYESSPFYTYGQKKFHESYSDAVMLVEREKNTGNASTEIAASVQSKIANAKAAKARHLREMLNKKMAPQIIQMEYFSVLSTGKPRFEPQATIFQALSAISTVPPPPPPLPPQPPHEVIVPSGVPGSVPTSELEPKAIQEELQQAPQEAPALPEKQEVPQEPAPQKTEAVEAAPELPVTTEPYELPETKVEELNEPATAPLQHEEVQGGQPAELPVPVEAARAPIQQAAAPTAPSQEADVVSKPVEKKGGILKKFGSLIWKKQPEKEVPVQSKELPLEETKPIETPKAKVAPPLVEKKGFFQKMASFFSSKKTEKVVPVPAPVQPALESKPEEVAPPQPAVESKAQIAPESVQEPIQEAPSEPALESKPEETVSQPTVESKVKQVIEPIEEITVKPPADFKPEEIPPQQAVESKVKQVIEPIEEITVKPAVESKPEEVAPAPAVESKVEATPEPLQEPIQEAPETGTVTPPEAPDEARIEHEHMQHIEDKVEGLLPASK